MDGDWREGDFIMVINISKLLNMDIKMSGIFRM